MQFPEYVPTRTVSLGGAMVLESAELLKIAVTITSSMSLEWDATGYRFEKLGRSVTSELGSEILFPLPRTDVSGEWRTTDNELIVLTEEGQYTHRYTAAVSFRDADGKPVGSSFTIGPFPVPAGSGVLDLARTVPASTVAGERILVPDLWGQLVAEAQAAAERASEALLDSAEFVGTQIATPGTPAQIAVYAAIQAAGGGGGGPEGLRHVQSVPSSSWVISHPFGREPSVAVYVGGEHVETDVIATSANATITFPTPTAGVAILN